jgi:hypothetical protein
MALDDFKRSCKTASKRLKRLGLYIPCAQCGKLVKRYPSQRAQAKLIFCSRSHKVLYYQGLQKPAIQHALGVSPLIAKALALETDPWSLSKHETEPL